MDKQANITQFARVTAAVLWADEKDTPEEWVAAEALFLKNNLNWEEAKSLVEEEIEALIDEDEEGSESEEDEDLTFGAIDLGAGVDPYEVLVGLAKLACADKELTWNEIDMIHRLGEAMNIQGEMVSAALLTAASSADVSVVLD